MNSWRCRTLSDTVNCPVICVAEDIASVRPEKGVSGGIEVTLRTLKQIGFREKTAGSLVNSSFVS